MCLFTAVIRRSFFKSMSDHMFKWTLCINYNLVQSLAPVSFSSLLDFNEQYCLKISSTSLFAYITISMCLPCHPPSNSPHSRPDAEITGETKTAEEFPNHLSSSEESTGSWSQLANDEDNPDDTSSYLQLSERSLRYPYCLFSVYNMV